jgi:hypothetical protein
MRRARDLCEILPVQRDKWLKREHKDYGLQTIAIFSSVISIL